MHDYPIDFLVHIRNEVLFIRDTMKDILDKDIFLRNELIKRGIVRSLEIIGEASKKISVDLKLKWNNIEWKQVAGMRDRLIHDDVGVNYNIVCDVAKNKIPILLEQVQHIIDIEKNTPS